tara:strand:+ start:13252 stop:14223 length:972 start_codon:yes stop_codon:yes gene_type:complete
MSQKENKESQLKIIDEKTDDFLKTLLNIKVNNEENYEENNNNNTILEYNFQDDDDDDDDYVFDDSSSSVSSNASKSIKSAISKIFPSFKEKDYKLIKQKVDKLSEIINKINEKNPVDKEISGEEGKKSEEEKKKEKEDKENLKKEIKKLIITILQLNNESNIIDAYEPLFTKNLIVSTDIEDSEYILDIVKIKDKSENDIEIVIGISGVLNKDFIGKLKYLDEIIQLKEKTKDNVKNIIAEVGNTSIKELEDLLEKQKKAKEEKQINLISKDAVGNAITLGMQNTLQNQANPKGGKRTFKRRRKTRINKKNKRKTNKSKQNKK